MTKEKGACPGVPALGQAVEMVATCTEPAFSTSDFITAAAGRQMRIADLLLMGEENAIPLRHLKKMVDLPGREVRRLIQVERLHGIPILSDNMNGYFLPENDLERDKFVRSMRGRAAEIEAVADAVEKAVIC